MQSRHAKAVCVGREQQIAQREQSLQNTAISERRGRSMQELGAAGNCGHVTPEAAYIRIMALACNILLMRSGIQHRLLEAECCVPQLTCTRVLCPTLERVTRSQYVSASLISLHELSLVVSLWCHTYRPRMSSFRGP